MRFSISKNLGHGLRVGVSEQVGDSRNSRRPSPTRSSPAAFAALSEAEQQHAALEQQAVKVARNAVAVEAELRKQENRLHALRAARMQLEAAATQAADDDQRRQILATITQHSVTIMDGERNLAQLGELWRTASVATAQAREAVARNRARLDALIAQRR